MLVVRLRIQDDAGCSKCCNECLKHIKIAEYLGVNLKVKYIDESGEIQDYTDNDIPARYGPKMYYW
jgi:hypothetical protein